MPSASCPPATLLPDIRMAASTPEKETIASTDRSMPPVSMTKVCPAATRPIADASSISSAQLVGFLKAGAMAKRRAKSAMKTSSGPRADTIRPKTLPLRSEGAAIAISVMSVNPAMWVRFGLVR